MLHTRYSLKLWEHSEAESEGMEKDTGTFRRNRLRGKKKSTRDKEGHYTVMKW